MKIGIDPGNTGAIAFLDDDNQLISVHDMPLMANGKKQQLNGAELHKILYEYLAFNPTAYVEQVHAMPKQGVSSTFSFGMGYGLIQGLLQAMGIPFFLVTPHSWKKPAGLVQKDKDNARTLAQQLYPEAGLGRKKDIGRADAILIARYGSSVKEAA